MFTKDKQKQYYNGNQIEKNRCLYYTLNTKSNVVYQDNTLNNEIVNIKYIQRNTQI